MSTGFATPGTPNLPDFLAFLATSVQIPAAALPPSSAFPGYALEQAIALVLCPPAGLAAPVMYSLACYNCATHLLFLITPDQPGQTYFQGMRSSAPTTTGSTGGGFGLNAPSTGIVVTTFDQGTGSTVTAPEWAQNMTIDQLGYFKTPWGREYLAWQQKYGSTIWGLT